MVGKADDLGVTRDTLWAGSLVFWQPARGSGYRFNLDAILLAGFVRPAHHIVDLGAGCGIVGTLLLAESKARQVTGVEIQSQLVGLAERNAQENGFRGRLVTRAGDLRSVELPFNVDAVVFNPPYFRVGEGRSAPDPGREIARRERHGTLEDFVRYGLRCLNHGGSLYCIVRTDRLEEVAIHVAHHGGSVLRSRWVHARSNSSPRHVLIEAGRGRSGVWHRMPPLVVHDRVGYTGEVRSLLREPALT